MKIRNATIKDLEQLSQLFNGYRVFYKQESDVNAAKTFLSERIEMGDSVIYVAEEDDKLCGFVQLYPMFSSVQMKRLWLLNDLYVMKNQRGKGISKQLIEQAKVLAKETNSCGLTLETGKNNIVGNKLYPSVGFELDAGYNMYDWEL